MGRQKRNQDPLLAERIVESERRAGIELAWIVVAGIALCAAAIHWEIPDRLLEALDGRDRWNVNGILALVVVVPFGATAFALRRYRDAVGAQQELTRLSLHDALTGLPNRRHLREVLPEALQYARRNNTRSAVIFVDLDGFKSVNDTYGHEVGDQLMRAVGARLQTEMGAGRFVARYAGDEFVIIDPAPSAMEGATRLARELVQLIEVPFDLGEDRISISASVGIAMGDSTDDPEDLLRDADTAMYDAKNTAERIAVFDKTMRNRLTPVNAERRLEEALTQGEFRLFYQPLVTLRDGKMVGVEALLRWAHPQRGILRPSEFLPALEDTGLIVPVGRWLVNEACVQARRWADAAPPGRRPLRVSINISPRQLSQSDFVEVVRESVETSGVNPAQIYLELTETALVSDVRLAWAALGAAREIGVGLALDDFGTGYSSISHLRNFDLELVKLDRSYVVGLGESPEDDAIVRHIIALGRSLGIATLAEGVSEQSHVQRLLDLGCELGQGVFFADAQPSTVIDRLLERDTAAPVTAAETTPENTDAGTVVIPTLRKAEVAPDG